MVNMKLAVLLICLVLVTTNLQQVKCVIEYEEVRNSAGQVQFRVLDDNRIRFANGHREKNPSLRISLRGANVNKITHSTASSWTLELSDRSNATISVEKELSNLNEYYFQWFGGVQNAKREVCFHYGYNDASWYATYQSSHPEWPLNTSRSFPRKVFNANFQYDRADQANNEVLYILEHLFVNTDGYAILPDEQSPLFLRRDLNNDDPILCFSVDNIYPYKEDEKDLSYLDLKIRIFASKNIRTVTEYVVDQSGYIAKPTSMPDERKFHFPSWIDGQSNQSSTLSLASDLAKHGFPNGELYIPDWRGYEGYWGFEVIKSKYSDIGTMASDLTREGFRIALYISPRMYNYYNVIKHTEQYFLTDKSGQLTDSLDFSNPDTCEWYYTLLRKLYFEHGIDSFFAYPSHSNSFKAKDSFFQRYPSQLTKKYLETVFKMGNKATFAFAYKTQNLPIFVQQTCDSMTNEQLLKDLIPASLSISIGGYSFFVPSPTLKETHLEERVFIRWLQSVSLMSSIFIGNIPWKDQNYSPKVTELTSKFLDLHSKHAQTLVDLAKKRIQSGGPTIRPMWYVAPDDPRSYKVADQYMVGDDIVVAPIVDATKLERQVFLPSGTWLDQHGKSHLGPSEIKVAVPIEELAYFKRKV